MEVSRPVLAGPNAQASVSVSLHPLVLVNISDHWTRSKAQNDGGPGQSKDAHPMPGIS